jgi:hypothetical protein
MPVPNESVRLQLSRYGDEWRLEGAQRTLGLSPLRPLAFEVEDGATFAGPGELLEAVGQELDRLETQRVIAGGQHGPDVRDLAAVLEALEQAPDGLMVETLARVTGIPTEARLLAALEHARADGAAELTRPAGAAERWRLTAAARDLEDERAAAEDDARGARDR